MDKRKTRIRELEEKKLSDTETMNRLLEGLGGALLRRIGDGEDGGLPGGEKQGETPAAVLAVYRGLQEEIRQTVESIDHLEAEMRRLKELEAAIGVKEGEKNALERDMAAAETRLGKALLLAPGAAEFAGPLKQREEYLAGRIEEHKGKLESLDSGEEGGVLGWIGRNTQKAFSKTLLYKDSASLTKLYRETGGKSLEPSAASPETPPASPETVSAAREEALELKTRLASVTEELSGLTAQRRTIIDLFGAAGSPVRRIDALNKHFAQVQGEFPGVFRRFAAFAAAAGTADGGGTLAALLREEDKPALEGAALLAAGIAEMKLAVEKLEASITIDDEKAEIEKMKKAIAKEKEKIAAAERTIDGLEKQINETEKRVGELNAFVSGGEKPLSPS